MDAWLNPTTADYQPTAAGDLARDPADGLANAVYLRLMTPLGSWWADPALGSRLHELQRAKATDGIDQRAQEYCRIALQPLLDDGRAQAIDISTQLQTAADASKRLALLVTVTDAAGRSQPFQLHVKVA